MTAVPFHPGLFEAGTAPGAAPRVIASRCRACGRHAFPAKRFCSACHAGDMEQVHLAGLGRVYAFTHVALPPKAMGRPYIAAYVDMDEGVRMFGQVQDVGAGDLRIGDRVRADFRIVGGDAQGEPVVAYAFVPHKED